MGQLEKCLFLVRKVTIIQPRGLYVLALLISFKGKLKKKLETFFHKWHQGFIVCPCERKGFDLVPERKKERYTCHSKEETKKQKWK